MNGTTALASRRLTVALAMIVLAIGAWLRLSGLERKLYWYDEVATLLSLSGHSQDDMRRLYDGTPRTAASLRQFQAPHDDHGASGVAGSMLTDEPQSSLAYFLAARIAVRAWGVNGPRAISAIANLCAVLVVGLLAFQLFDIESGWLAAVLVAASPLQIRYAQEARPYGFWSLAVSLGSLLLWRALRVGTRIAWIAYGLAMALALYVHMMSLLVLAAHAVYVLWRLRQGVEPRRSAWRPTGGFAVALLLYAPWAVVVAHHHRSAQRELSWTSKPFTAAELAHRWVSTTTNVFVHSGADGGLVGGGQSPPEVAARAAIAVALLSILVFCGRSLVRHRSRAAAVLVALLGLVPLLGLALPDVVFGGQRSMIPRYLLPVWIALELTVAGGLGRKLFRTGGRIGVGSVIAAVLVSAGLTSACRARALPAWWDTDPGDLRAIEQASTEIQARSPTVVISDAEPRWILVLLQRLRDDVSLRLVTGAAAVDWNAAKRSESMFFFMPSPSLLKAATAAGIPVHQCVDIDNVHLWCAR